jgi:hypothetical protein
MSQSEYWLSGSRPSHEPRSGGERRPGPCDERGCVGPFANQSSRQGDAGTVFGDCMECGRRVQIPPSTRGFESLGRMVEAIIPPAEEDPSIPYIGPRRRRAPGGECA